MKAFYIKAMVLMVLLSTSAFAGVANDLTVSGKVTDWDHQTVYLMDKNGLEFGIPRSLLKKNETLSSGKNLSISMSTKTFKSQIFPRHKASNKSLGAH